MQLGSRRGQALLLLLLAGAAAAAARQLRQQVDGTPQGAPQEVDVLWTDPGMDSWDGLEGGWYPQPDQLAPAAAPAAAEAPTLAVAEVASVQAWSKPAACNELTDDEFWAAFAALGAACPDSKPYSCPEACLPAMQALHYRCASAAAKAAAEAVGFDPELAADWIVGLFRACPLALLDSQEGWHLPPGPSSPPQQSPPPSPSPLGNVASRSPAAWVPSPNPYAASQSPAVVEPSTSPSPPPPPPPSPRPPPPTRVPRPSLPVPTFPVPTSHGGSSHQATAPGGNQAGVQQPAVVPTHPKPFMPVSPVQPQPAVPVGPAQQQRPSAQPQKPSKPGVLIVSPSGAYVKPPRGQQQQGVRPLPQSITQAPTFKPQAGVQQQPMRGGGLHTRAQVGQHATPASCWVIIDGAVYDLTPFLASQRHPGAEYVGAAPGRALGGNAALRPFCGQDATLEFNRRHPPGRGALAQALAYRIGALLA